MKLADQMRATFARWEESGLSLLAFGKQEGITYSKLIYWRRRFQEEESAGKQRRARRSGALVPVSVVPDPAPSAPKTIEVWLHNGVSLEVPFGFDESELRRLVGVLSTC